MSTRTAKKTDEKDREDLAEFLSKARRGKDGGDWFSSLTLQMLTGIPSERCYRALHGAPGVERRNHGAMTQFRWGGP